MREKKLIILFLVVILSTSFFSEQAYGGSTDAGIEFKESMNEVGSIIRTGERTAKAVLKVFETVKLIDDLPEAKALLGSYRLEEYEEPADPETHVKEYFSVYREDLPEVEEDVLHAWENVQQAKQEKREAMLKCSSLVDAAECVKKVSDMAKHVVKGNKEAASSGRALFQLVSLDLEELRHRGAGRFYYHGPAYQTYYQAAKKLQEKHFPDFFQAMEKYGSMNEKALKGEAEAMLLLPDFSDLRKVFRLELKVIVEEPTSFHQPYNQLISYKGESALQKMLGFKQELVEALESMRVYYREWGEKFEKRKKEAEELKDRLEEEGIDYVRKEELGFFSSRNPRQKYQEGKQLSFEAVLQEENASWLREDRHREYYLALATREMQSAHSKAVHAGTAFNQSWRGLKNIKEKAGEKCWEAELEENTWFHSLINSRIRKKCRQGDQADTLGESIKHYYDALQDYMTVNSEDHGVQDTRKLLDELEVLLEKAEEDLDVSTEKKIFNSLEKRFKESSELGLEEEILELMDINSRARSLKEEILRKARVEYRELEPLQQSLREENKKDKYSEFFPLDYEESLGWLSEMEEYYQEKKENSSHPLTRLRYEFEETPRCNQEIKTKFIVKLENPFPASTVKTPLSLNAIPSRLNLNNHSAYSEGRTLFFSAPSLQPVSSKKIILTGTSTPLKCEELKEELVREEPGYSVYSSKKLLIAATDLPASTIQFKKPLLETDQGRIKGNSVWVDHVEKGNHTLTVQYLVFNASTAEKSGNSSQETVRENSSSPVSSPHQNTSTGKTPAPQLGKEEQKKKQENLPSRKEADEQMELNYSLAKTLLRKLGKACETEVEINHSIPVEFDEQDLEEYEEMLEEKNSQKQINSLNRELKNAWERLMLKAKREIEETETLMEEENDYQQVKWLDKARLEYEAGYFNKAFIYAHHARSLVVKESLEKTPATGLLPGYSIPVVILLLGLVFLVLYFRRPEKKKTPLQRIIQKVREEAKKEE